MSSKILTVLVSLFIINCFVFLSYSCRSVQKEEITKLPEKDYSLVLNMWFDKVESQDINTMKKMIKNGFPIDSVGKRSEGFDYEFTALMLASSFGDIETVYFLLDNKANVNYKTMRGTALLMATANGQRDIVYLLLSKKANPNIVAVDGRTPLMAASSEGDYELVYELLKSGANRTLKHSSGNTALDYAIKGGYKDIVRLLKIN